MYAEKSKKQIKDAMMIQGGEFVSNPKQYYFIKKHGPSIQKSLHEKRFDIEKYIAACMYYDRDLMPHDGRYYNREKWLEKIK